MTEAGRLILQGSSLKQALIKVGFSESTARCPKLNNLNAEQCVKLALDSDETTNPSKLRESANKLFQKTLDTADPEKTGLVAAARAAEIAGKIDHRAGQHEPQRPRSLEERIHAAALLILQCEGRGMNRVHLIAELSEGDSDIVEMMLNALAAVEGRQAPAAAPRTIEAAPASDTTADNVALLDSQSSAEHS